MNITRLQAIKILDEATDHGGFDDWWVDLMEEHGLYNEETEDWPTIFEVFNALGVSDEEMKEAGVM
jgi:hypothetical protein